MGNKVNFNIWVTNQCNLACEYCYEKEKGELFLEGDSLEYTINFIISYIHKNLFNECNIHFHGGEPTLNYKIINTITESLNQIEYVSFKYSITTNAAFNNEKILQFLIGRMDFIVVSIDGNKPWKNKKRISKNGVNITEQVIKNIDYLVKRHHNVAIRMTVEPDNVENLYDSVTGFVKMGYKNIYHALDIWNTEWTESDFRVYYNQLKTIYKEYKNRSDLSISGAQKHEIVKRKECLGGNSDITVYPDGTIYPCTVVAGDKEYCIGSVRDGIFEGWDEKLQYINSLKMKECEGCSLLEDCMANRCRFVNKVLTGRFDKTCECICWMENIWYGMSKNF